VLEQPVAVGLAPCAVLLLHFAVEGLAVVELALARHLAADGLEEVDPFVGGGVEVCPGGVVLEEGGDFIGGVGRSRGGGRG